MENYLANLEARLKKEINLEEILIIDNSQKHKNHKFFSKEKYHLHLKIKSIYLKSISKINAHKLIMKILRDDLKTKIHALEITIN
tara:strand:+ start:10842 stop:11096 length:255 start_codon:yes stop_codon:yes gene_type:complete